MSDPGGRDDATVREALREKVARTISVWQNGSGMRFEGELAAPYLRAADAVLAALDLPARYAEVRAEALREAADKVQAVFDLQCPPATPSAYVDRGAYMAHKWWDTVLGGKLRDLRASAAAALASAGPVDIVECAKALATRAHHGQVDKVGAPYIGHPARIVAALVKDGQPPEVQAVGWLHDVVEDTDVTLEQLAESFPSEVVEAVDAISKRRGERFDAYYERVKANPLALVVKWHDVADNADPARLAKVAPDTRERLRGKYERARRLLRETAGPVEPSPAAEEARQFRLGLRFQDGEVITVDHAQTTGIGLTDDETPELVVWADDAWLSLDEWHAGEPLT